MKSAVPQNRSSHPSLQLQTACVEREEAKSMAEERQLSTSSRKKSVAQEQVTSVLRGDQVPIYDREFTADEEVLAALGYKPEFKREFSLWTSFCVSFAVLGLLPSFASTLYYVSCMCCMMEGQGLTSIREWDMQAHLEWFGGGWSP